MYADRVMETTAAGGTGNLTPTGAVSGYRTIASQYPDLAQGPFLMRNGATEWEVSMCTFRSGTIARDQVLSSSNGGALVNFSAAPTIASDLPASMIADLSTTIGIRMSLHL